MRSCHRHHTHGYGFRQNTTSYIAINTRLCLACWKCVAACQQGVLGKTDFFFHRHVRIINPKACIGCRVCEKVCPEGAIAALIRAKGPLED